MLISSIRKFTVLYMIAALLIMAACGDKESEKKGAVAESKFSDWKTYTYGNTRILYPEDHPQKDRLYEIATKYQFTIRKTAELLGIEAPTDTVVIVFYPGLYTGREMTGSQYPYAVGDTVHFWLPGYFGPPMVEYVLGKWHPQPPRYKFLKHGLMTLLDGSGKNKHTMTLERISDGRFLPLESLAVDTAVNVYVDRIQSAEGASFVDFVIYQYGSEAFKLMYRSQAPFDQTVRGILNISVDSLQTLWLDVAKKAGKMDTAEMESDGTDAP